MPSWSEPMLGAVAGELKSVYLLTGADRPKIARALPAEDRRIPRRRAGDGRDVLAREILQIGAAPLLAELTQYKANKTGG